MTEEVKLRDHISLAEFLQNKSKCRITTFVPEESHIAGDGRASPDEEVSGESAAQYWEALISSRDLNRPAEPWEDRGSHPGLLNPRYLEFENLKLGLTHGDDELDYVAKITLAGKETEYQILIEGKESNYISNSGLKRDVRIMANENEPSFRDGLVNEFEDQLPPDYFN